MKKRRLVHIAGPGSVKVGTNIRELIFYEWKSAEYEKEKKICRVVYSKAVAQLNVLKDEGQCFYDGQSTLWTLKDHDNNFVMCGIRCCKKIFRGCYLRLLVTEIDERLDKQDERYRGRCRKEDISRNLNKIEHVEVMWAKNEAKHFFMEFLSREF
ncbi:unnamed protein product [Caenorhabditis brenneri]